MRIGYITKYDYADMSEFSGLGYYIHKSLAMQNIHIKRNHYLFAIKDRLYKRFSKKRYLREREVSIAKGYARQVKKKISDIEIDLILSPGTIPVAFLESKKPIVFWTDATFSGMVNFYPEFNPSSYNSS